jgi:hypothetical protein
VGGLEPDGSRGIFNRRKPLVDTRFFILIFVPWRWWLLIFVLSGVLVYWACCMGVIVLISNCGMIGFTNIDA